MNMNKQKLKEFFYLIVLIVPFIIYSIYQWAYRAFKATQRALQGFFR